MDFVILGVGIGALAMIVGVALRDFFPAIRNVAPAEVPFSDLTQRRRLMRGARGGGRVLLSVGGLLISVTMLAVMIRVSDRAGMLLTLIMAALSLTALVGWLVGFIWRERPRYQQTRELQRLNRRLRRESVSTAPEVDIIRDELDQSPPPFDPQPRRRRPAPPAHDRHRPHTPPALTDDDDDIDAFRRVRERTRRATAAMSATREDPPSTFANRNPTNTPRATRYRDPVATPSESNAQRSSR